MSDPLNKKDIFDDCSGSKIGAEVGIKIEF
jgi:hypothetical protein